MNTRPSFVPVVMLTLLAACGGSAPSAPEAPKDPVTKAPGREAKSPEAPAASATLALSGTITYAGPINGPSLFISVKDPGKPGPPLAAKQLPPGPFPMAFTLGDADVVQMGAAPRPIPADVALTVRIDADGDAMTKDPTEPIATLKTPATTSGLAVTLVVP
jgi:hypothetical protein